MQRKDAGQSTNNTARWNACIWGEAGIFEFAVGHGGSSRQENVSKDLLALKRGAFNFSLLQRHCACGASASNMPHKCS